MNLVQIFGKGYRLIIYKENICGVTKLRQQMENLIGFPHFGRLVLETGFNQYSRYIKDKNVI